jgi:hypothetical protein
MYYQHSGRFSIGGLVVGLVIGAAAGFLLAYAYGNGLILIPEAHLAAFATLAFGGFVGAATGYGLVWGQVRNTRLTVAVAAVTSTVALYLSWAIWIAAALKRGGGKPISWAKLTQHPAAIWSLMKWINHYGTWSLDNGSATTGWSLWLIWALEAVLVVGLAVAAGVAILRQRPFCETCGRWCPQSVKLFLAPLPDVQPLKLQLETGDLRSLESLGPGQKAGDHLIVCLHGCDHCNQFHTLTVTQVSIRRRKFGNPNVSSKVIVRQLIVGPGEAQTLRQLSEKIAQAPKPSSEKARGAAAGGIR